LTTVAHTIAPRNTAPLLEHTTSTPPTEYAAIELDSPPTGRPSDSKGYGCEQDLQAIGTFIALGSDGGAASAGFRQAITALRAK